MLAAMAVVLARAPRELHAQLVLSLLTCANKTISLPSVQRLAGADRRGRLGCSAATGRAFIAVYQKRRPAFQVVPMMDEA